MTTDTDFQAALVAAQQARDAASVHLSRVDQARREAADEYLRALEDFRTSDAALAVLQRRGVREGWLPMPNRHGEVKAGLEATGEAQPMKPSTRRPSPTTFTPSYTTTPTSTRRRTRAPPRRP